MAKRTTVSSHRAGTERSQITIQRQSRQCGRRRGLLQDSGTALGTQCGGEKRRAGSDIGSHYVRML